MAAHKAVVVGATGVVGRNLIRHLAALDDWRVTGLSRRKPDLPEGADWIEVDLSDRAQAEERLAALFDATHLFYAGYTDRPGAAELVAPNLALLIHAVEALEGAAPDLAHVNLIEGTKWYGSHLGPFRTPAKEDDARHLPPNFYYDQQDWLAEHQRGKRWTWSALRPHAICGFALGNPMNLTTVIAVYAAISKELGLPLKFPGKPGAYDALYQVTDSGHLAKAMVWCATDPRCANSAFNLTNGDVFRWRHLWPGFAEFFGMALGDAQQISLTRFMADKAPVWDRIVARHGLQPIPFAEIAAWPFGDFVFSADYDVMSDTSKARRHGFHEVVDSEEMFLRLFAEFRAARVIP
jgi:nucleoside-diphosphate-sugar epimerase